MEICFVSRYCPLIVQTSTFGGKRGSLLVFDCEPEQYAKAAKYIEENPGAGKWWRLKIPCVRGEENAWDYEDFLRSIEERENRGKKPEFTGRFEHWPDDYPYEIQEIVSDGEEKSVQPSDGPWPPKDEDYDETLPDARNIGTTTVCSLKKNAICSLYRLCTHNIVTGLSRVQQAMIDSGVNHADILVHEVSTQFGLSTETVKAQFDLLTRGNRPMIKQRGRFIERRPKIPLFPYHLINGPFPLSPDKVAATLQGLISEYRGETTVPPPLLPLEPSCVNCRFVVASNGGHYVSVAYIGAGETLHPPYSGSLDGFDVESITPSGVISGLIELRQTHKIIPDWEYLDGKDAKRSNGPMDYLVEWLTVTSAHLLENRVDRLKYARYETLFLSHIFHGHLVERQNIAKGLVEYPRRIYLEETEDERRQTILHTYGGYFELENLPIKKLSPRIIMDEEPSTQSFNAMSEIRASIQAILQ